MAWLTDFIKKIWGLFSSGQKDDTAEILDALLELKEEKAFKVRTLSDTATRLNDEFKSVVEASDSPGLISLKTRFQELGDDVMDIRHSINKSIQELRQVQSSSDNPAIEEAMDEYSEIIKSLNYIIKNQKAVQHYEIEEQENSFTLPPPRIMSENLHFTVWASI